MKRVSFKVAKVIKEAGYPQEWNNTEYYYSVSGELKHCDDYEGNNIEDIMFYQRNAIPAPFVMEVWLWLWREKKIILHPEYYDKDSPTPFWSAYMEGRGFNDTNYNDLGKYDDPEDAIEKAIEHIVLKNGLIK